jgi:ABC-type nickel/cobalt efflux system permease component RcnA
MAEIPTFQESAAIDADKDGALIDAELDAYAEKILPAYISNLLLAVDGQTIQLRSVAKSISLPEGAGNLPTLRIVWDLIGDLPESSTEVSRLKFENKNHLDRIGWNEIVVGRAAGVSIFDSTAYGSAATDELKAYPQETLSLPLAERTAEFLFTSTAVPMGARLLQNRDGHIAAPVAAKDKFAELISVPEITPQIILFGLLVAFGLGAAHALSPGHGKAVVGAYLVGSKGTPKHAVFLGATVTVTHTLGVFALGIVMYFASAYVLPERIMPYLSFASGLLVLFIGLTLFKNRLLSILGYETGGHHAGDSHEHDDIQENFTHTHGGRTHTHVPPQKVTWRNLLALGISGGLLPCPSALVLMLAAINLNRIGYGIVLTVVFSLGLAATLTAVGLVFLYGGRILDSPALSENRIVKTVPVFSAFVITCVGAVICYNSLV